MDTQHRHQNTNQQQIKSKDHFVFLNLILFNPIKSHHNSTPETRSWQPQPRPENTEKKETVSLFFVSKSSISITIHTHIKKRPKSPKVNASHSNFNYNCHQPKQTASKRSNPHCYYYTTYILLQFFKFSQRTITKKSSFCTRMHFVWLVHSPTLNVKRTKRRPNVYRRKQTKPK